jgi:hypothetical protein
VLLFYEFLNLYFYLNINKLKLCILRISHLKIFFWSLSSEYIIFFIMLLLFFIGTVFKFYR